MECFAVCRDTINKAETRTVQMERVKKEPHLKLVQNDQVRKH